GRPCPTPTDRACRPYSRAERPRRPLPIARKRRQRPRARTDRPGAGWGGRQGSGWCPPPARRTGRSSTATRQCGSTCEDRRVLLLLLLLLGLPGCVDRLILGR